MILVLDEDSSFLGWKQTKYHLAISMPLSMRNRKRDGLWNWRPKWSWWPLQYAVIQRIRCYNILWRTGFGSQTAGRWKLPSKVNLGGTKLTPEAKYCDILFATCKNSHDITMKPLQYANDQIYTSNNSSGRMRDKWADIFKLFEYLRHNRFD